MKDKMYSITVAYDPLTESSIVKYKATAYESKGPL